MSVIFSKRFKELRQKNGLLQADLAEIFGVSKSTIGFWENNRQEPNMEMIQRIADYFATDPNYLLGFDSSKKNNE